ncbi:MAG: DUF4019 domain-containing protein [bacterium]
MKKWFLFILMSVFVISVISCKSSETNLKKEDDPQKKVIKTENNEITNEAVEVAESWLSLVDSGSYGESWEKAATFFKEKVSKDKWIDNLNGVLPPFGKVIKREVISADFYTELPGAPDGEYVVVKFKTSFENKKNSVETVTPMKDDGKWKVSGYYIN